MGDASAILGAVSFAVLFDLHRALGFVAALLSAILGQRAPALRTRTGLAILGGALLHVWLGLDVQIEGDVAQRAALAMAAAVVGVIVVARLER